MQAARWADDIRIRDKQHHRALWHYINWRFKPEIQPTSLQNKDPESVNILTTMVENQRIMASENDRERKAIALAWLFHLVGDIHSLCTLCSCLLMSIPRATEVGMKSV